MRKLLVYSHDTFGMGNIRRMLALSEYLIETTPDISILLITGSPVIHDLRLPERLDYIKLPCLTRTASNVYSAKTLGTGIEETMRLRADLILAAAMHFRPDLVLVDKKPCGVKNELARTLEYLKMQSNARIALVLRDILDSPENTIPVWNSHCYSEQIASYYDKVFVLGVPEIFDPRVEYALPPAVSAKTVFCGYLGKRRAVTSRAAMRKELGVASDERLVLVTAGDGEDGHPIVQTYCAALPEIDRLGRIRSVIITGPEMPAQQRSRTGSSPITISSPNVPSARYRRISTRAFSRRLRRRWIGSVITSRRRATTARSSSAPSSWPPWYFRNCQALPGGSASPRPSC